MGGLTPPPRGAGPVDGAGPDRRPTLRTERMRLEPLTADHAEALVELDADPVVLRHVFGRALGREEVLTTWLPRRTRPDAAARGLGWWMGYPHDGGPDDWLGWWCLAVDDDDPGAAELGYRLRRTAWGAGFATEGARALVRHGVETVGLRLVWAEAMATNAASCRVLEKAGLRHVRTEVRRWEHPIEGWEQGEARYELLREPDAAPDLRP